jgi:tRNA (uracil-5-)-methyltransferase
MENANSAAESLLKKRTNEELHAQDLAEKTPNQIDQQENQDEPAAPGESKLADGEVDPLRLCLMGIDPYTKEKDIIKFCQNEFTPPLDVKGINKKQGKNHAFVAFASVEERQRFEKEAEGKKLKNRKVKWGTVRVDHQALKYEKKLKTGEEGGLGFLEQKPRLEAKPEDIEAEMSRPIQEKVCPLWKTPYEEQEKMGFTAMENVLKKISVNAIKTLKHEDPGLYNLPDWLADKRDGPCIELNKFIGADSDKTFYYRNKAEFTIGESHFAKGQTKVGFNMGNFAKGFMFVEDAENCPIVSKESLELAKILENFVQTCDIPAYHRFEHTGFWRALVVRQSEATKQLIINVVAAKNSISEERYNQLKQELADLFTQKFNLNDYKIVSILLQDHSGISDNVPTDSPYDILYGGQDYYMDEIMGFKFRVNISAFLQVNSSQTDKLYGLVKKLADVDKDTILLDICCGIGTIGICAASSAKKIVGIEMVDRAIEDAKFNAGLNELTNTEYHVNKVEAIIADVIKPYMGSKIIGIVDPPRAGLHKDVIKALRTCKGLDKLIYVSCNPEGSMVDNVLGLCLPETKRRRAPPFTITEAYGVDLFPQTHHFEGVLLLERLYNQKKEKKEEVVAAAVETNKE